MGKIGAVPQVGVSTRRGLSLFLLFFLALFVTSRADSETFQYESRGRRDPFVPLIGPDKPLVAGLEDITSVEDVKLEGIAIGGKGRRAAIINGEMLKENDTVGILTVKKITKKVVTILLGPEEYNLNISEEGGLK